MEQLTSRQLVAVAERQPSEAVPMVVAFDKLAGQPWATKASVVGLVGVDRQVVVVRELYLQPS